MWEEPHSPSFSHIALTCASLSLIMASAATRSPLSLVLDASICSKSTYLERKARHDSFCGIFDIILPPWHGNLLL